MSDDDKPDPGGLRASARWLLDLTGHDPEKAGEALDAWAGPADTEPDPNALWRTMLGGMIGDTLKTIRDQTREKVRRREFAERMAPEERRRTEEHLAAFTEHMDRAIAGFARDEEE